VGRMKRSWMLATIVFAVCFLGAGPRAVAEVFKSGKECGVGKRVVDNGGKHGRITKSDGTICTVAIDGGREEARLFWMLHLEGGSAETDDKLVPGKYECFANLRYTFMDVYITGANTYRAADTSGKFHVEPSRKIVFETGSLAKYNAKLLRGPSIGLNTDGGEFWGTTCELKKS
jgi:hypothetical protein